MPLFRLHKPRPTLRTHAMRAQTRLDHPCALSACILRLDLGLSSSKLGLFRLSYKLNFACDEDTIEPGVVDELGGSGTFVGVETKHRGEEGGDGVCLIFGEEVFVMKNGFKRPETEFLDVSEFT